MREINKKKKEQLGVDAGTLSNQLKKELLFKYVKLANHNFCYQCGAEIEGSKDLSIEHKTPWLHSSSPYNLFMSLDNIAFSHLSCNIKAGRRVESKCGGKKKAQSNVCSCNLCEDTRNRYKEINRIRIKQKRELAKLAGRLNT